MVTRTLVAVRIDTILARRSLLCHLGSKRRGKAAFLKHDLLNWTVVRGGIGPPTRGLSEACSDAHSRELLSRDVLPMLMRRDTTRAMYMTPASDSSITIARAIGITGTMSLNPTLESTAT